MNNSNEIELLNKNNQLNEKFGEIFYKYEDNLSINEFLLKNVNNINKPKDVIQYILFIMKYFSEIKLPETLMNNLIQGNILIEEMIKENSKSYNYKEYIHSLSVIQNLCVVFHLIPEKYKECYKSKELFNELYNSLLIFIKDHNFANYSLLTWNLLKSLLDAIMNLTSKNSEIKNEINNQDWMLNICQLELYIREYYLLTNNSNIYDIILIIVAILDNCTSYILK